MKKIIYSEPADYIPEDIRRKLKLGEFSKDATKEKTISKATTKPKTRGTDAKGKWVMVNGKKCYSQADVEAQLKESLDDD